MKTKIFLALILALTYSLATTYGTNIQGQGDSFSVQAFEVQMQHPPQMTLADRKLEAIVQDQSGFLSELQDHPERFTASEEGRRFDVLFKQYDSFLLENPKNIFAYILYGKLLRYAGFIEEANRIFMLANEKDRNIAVVKQQIGNYLAEKGQFALALPYFLSAIEIEPKTAIYHYQLGELLTTFKDSFISEKILAPEQFDEQLLHAFYQAEKNDPSSWTYKVRSAEAFYDLNTPNWPMALALWNKLEPFAPNPKEKELVFLNKARVLIKLEQYKQAQEILAKVFSPEFEKGRRELLSMIPTLD